MQAITQRIHGLPEAVVVISAKLPIPGKDPEWFLLPGGVIAMDQIDDPRLKYEKATVDPSAIPFGLLLEP